MVKHFLKLSKNEILSASEWKKITVLKNGFYKHEQQQKKKTFQNQETFFFYLINNFFMQNCKLI